ncbi:PREDICTED: peptidylglycine alpha-hydroxylating monooxygenase-like [Wasmannia auropunctata]|uniref:peptidylglycine alpha-hydroxylating monooxygenase-like n=1 Tax=Wasmannia auropunctata TaxID=64793 RepID=UPI0005F08CAC|nr:PREDICTED: peptidylglycine alpha-hydroxylating monooxygenase-like [Wasmannia auropunctata]
MENCAFSRFFALAVFFKFTCSYDTRMYSLIMPNVRPNKPESYLCTPIKIDSARNYYIVGFEPNTTMATIHHMVVFGCTKPGSLKLVWECGQQLNPNNKIDNPPPCAKGAQVIYGWARDAPKFNLPEGVGFKIGGDSPIQYIVLQLHYAHVEGFKDGRTDDSGVFLYYTAQRMDKLAGIISLVSGGSIPAGKTTHMESACRMKENKTIYPFAFRTHTHSLATVGSGYVVKPNNNWIELGKTDPLKPQMFLPVTHKVPITYGDTLAARCTMKSTRDSITYVGKRNQDEMCNYYILYYVDEGTPLKQKSCFSPGPPSYYWKQELSNIPDEEASTL